MEYLTLTRYLKQFCTLSFDYYLVIIIATGEYVGRCKSIFILQMDVSAFRLLWDKSTAQCYVIEEARKKKEDKNVTQIYYWEVNW